MRKATIAAMCLIAAPLGAQHHAMSAPVPQISISARGETTVNPDRATIRIGVQTRAATAAAAATENASKQSAVIQALRGLGLRENEISTVGYTVAPEYRYEQNREPVVVGYVVTNTVSAEIRDLSLVGRVIDVSTSRGANTISSLRFYSSNTEDARREAIAQAVQKARLDAEAVARAAGGTVGELLEVNVGAYFPPPMPVEYARMAAQAAPDTPINPGEQTISVEVSTRWRFIPAQ